MTSESKPVRRVRFNLPEPKKPQTTSKEVKSQLHGTQKYVNGTLVASGSKSKTTSTPSIIVNKNASTSRRASVDSAIKPLPKIGKKEDASQRSNSSNMKRHSIASTYTAKSQPRPKTSTVTRSQSFSNKKPSQPQSETYVNKRYSDSFLYMDQKPIVMPSLKVTESLNDQSLVKIPVITEKDLDTNFLRIPVLEDDNANFLPQFCKGDGTVEILGNELSVMRGKMNNIKTKIVLTQHQLQLQAVA